MVRDIPAAYFDGITEVVVSPRTVAHPERADVFTLGECVPLNIDGGDPAASQSRVVLYHGSFAALAALDPEFDWDAETWETLIHELRHHVEWRADDHALEAFDRAVDANHARHAGAPWDPLFFQDGEEVAPGTFLVDGDCFIECVVREVPAEVDFPWRGATYRVRVPPGTTLPAYLSVQGIEHALAGELVLVVRRKARITDLFRASSPSEAVVDARPLPTDPTGGQ
ncbi:MAG: metallopeptidase family protein [Gemmatimonadales bacterium]|nr:metallopeptidase family protein [Gemmatimonadales bacterium]